MDIITLEDIRESNCIKKETCKSCMEQLKGKRQIFLRIS